MNFKEVIAEYKNRGAPLEADEIKARVHDEEWLAQCFRCDECDTAMLHDDEVHSVDSGIICDVCHCGF